MRVNTYDHGNEPLSRHEILEQPRQFALSKWYNLSLGDLVGSESGVVFEGGHTLAES